MQSEECPKMRPWARDSGSGADDQVWPQLHVPRPGMLSSLSFSTHNVGIIPAPESLHQCGFGCK